jgi:N utilization substance protein A
MEELEYIKTLEDLTRAKIRDCLVSDKEVVAVVEEGQMGLAIGRNGENITRAKEKLGRKISLIEFSNDLAQFARNVFAPVPLDAVETNGSSVKLKPRDAKRAVGRNNKRLERAKTLLSRHFGIKDVLITG